MITKFTVGNRDGSSAWDVSELTNNVKWVTDLNFAAGTLTFDVIKTDELFYPKSGDLVEFEWDGFKVFYGYVFKVGYSQDKKFSITAYDKLRYFKNQDSLVWPVSTVSQRFETVAKMAEVSYKVVNSSDYKLPAEVADGKTYFDMLKTAIDATQKATQQMFYLFANYDTVELRKAPYNQLELIVGDQSLMTGFSFDKSIEDAANIVRIIRKDQEESQSVASTSTDEASAEKTSEDPEKTSFSYTDSKGSNVGQWGKLQTTENAKDKANDAQMKQRADELLVEKNRETYSLRLNAIGDLSLVAGNSVHLQISDLHDVGFVIESAAILKATHNFGPNYNCELEMKVNEPWLENSSSS